VLGRDKFAKHLQVRGLSATQVFEGYAALVKVVVPAIIQPVIIEDPDDDHGAGSAALSSRTLPARDFSCQGLKPRAPEPPEWLQPDVSLSQRARVDGIDAACPLGAYRRKPALPQDLELLRHCRLSDTELPRDDLDDLPGRMLALDQEFQDAPSNRIAEDIERVHQDPV
jgi:hypothetical protein